MKVNFNKAPNSADEIGGLKVNYAPAKRPFAKWRFNLVFFIFMFPFISYIGYIAYSYVVVSEAGFVLLKDLKIKTPTDGVIEMIKPVGADVKKGDIVAVLSNHSLEEKYKSYSKKLEFNNKSIMETIENNRVMLKIAYDFYKSRDDEYKRLQRLRDKKLVTEHVLSNALVQLESSKLAYTNAKDSLENSKMALKDALSDKLKVEELREKLNSLVIKSPSDGIVTLNAAKGGELVQKYDDLLVIDMHTKPVMEVFLNPKHAKFAELGKKVKVVFPDNTKINAEVSKIQVRAVKTPIELTGIFKKAPYSIVLELKLEKKFPKKFMINYLPIKVTFNNFF
jgi:biotin carboxyl carrier protein